MDEKLIEDPKLSDGKKPRPGFYDRPVRGLSTSFIILGIFCLGIGIAVLVVAVNSECVFKIQQDYNDYGLRLGTLPPPIYKTHSCFYLTTYASPGIWSGLVYLASGIIGVLAARRKTTCFIVSMMIMAFFASLIAAGACTMAILANFDLYSYGYYWGELMTPYPISLRVGDALIAFSGLVAFILSWIKFGYACRALCCNGKKLCTASTKPCFHCQFRPVYSQPIMYTGALDQFAQGLPAMTQPMTEQAGTAAPIYLVQRNQVIGVLPASLPHVQALQGKQNAAVTVEPVTQA